MAALGEPRLITGLCICSATETHAPLLKIATTFCWQCYDFEIHGPCHSTVDDRLLCMFLAQPGCGIRRRRRGGCGPRIRGVSTLQPRAHVERKGGRPMGQADIRVADAPQPYLRSIR